jgi:hypothetical protein
MRVPALKFPVLMVVAACSSSEGLAASVLDVPDPVVMGALARNQVERDLTLTLHRTTTEGFEFERDPGFEVVLANGSKDRAYPVVLSSDGSEVGWREPHVFYTVEKRTPRSTAWQPAPERPLARCGNYDEDWGKDVVSLEPGRSVVLPWFRFYNVWDLEDATELRVVAHYTYGEHAKDLRKVVPVLHTMPAYTLASNALELKVEEPMVLEIQMHGDWPAPGRALAPAIEVVAVNESTRTLPFATADTGGNLEIDAEVETRQGILERLALQTGLSTADARETLPPGGRRSVIGPTTKSTEFSSSLPDGARVRRVRAKLHLWMDASHGNAGVTTRTAKSPWVATDP